MNTKSMKAGILLALFFTFSSLNAQILSLTDDFEGSGNSSWFSNQCGFDNQRINPLQNGSNPSSTVLAYYDLGALNAYIGMDLPANLDLLEQATFSFKIYVPSANITGNQTNQVSLKLQNSEIANPENTECEIVKNILTDQWQTLTFDFANDPIIKALTSTYDPVYRMDLNRLILQVNGENNNDQVQAFFDDFEYHGKIYAQSQYKDLIWSDEFDVDGAVDTSKWFHQTILPNGGSWFNGEVQHYTNRIDNSYIDQGVLKVTAKAEVFTDQGVTKNYTSARLNSKFAFEYGRVEALAKLPSGIGTWPAIWTLGKNINENGAFWQTQGFGNTSWPECGEIDIMEHWGDNPNYVQSALHTPSSHGATINHGGYLLPTATSDYHLYMVEWTPHRIRFSVDSIAFYNYAPEFKNQANWPFIAEQYLLLNFAIQAHIDPNFTEGSMDIDYIRVYGQGNPASIEKDIVKKDLKIFPNPFDLNFEINLSELQLKSGQIEIIDMNGRLLYSETLDDNKAYHSHNMNDFPSGMYLVKIISEDRIYIDRVIKK